MQPDYTLGAALVRPAERRVSVQGQALVLGGRAFDLLMALIERRDRVAGRDELLAAVWPGLVVEESNLSVQISALRKALGEQVIATVPGRGYQLSTPVVEQAQPAPSAALADVAEPGWLPAPMTALRGREAAQADVQGQLATTRCLTLVGAGGAGKTRLALAVAEAVRARHPGGVWWVGLEALSDPALLARCVATAVGCTDLRRPDAQALVQRLAGRPALLVWDNCEHLVEACAMLAAQLLRELPQLQLLITSRESLRIAGEKVWPVPPLAVPERDDAPPDALLRVASVQLLVERIQQHSPGFVAEAGDSAHLAQICRALEGLPLALELVAAQIGPRTLAEVAARLDRSLGLLNLGARGGLRHHQTMAAAIDWGFRLLGEEEQAVFQRLAVFHGGWTFDSAAAACEDLALEPAALPDVVGRLLRSSMVQAGPSAASGTRRFRMLEPVRQFGLAQLEELGLVDTVKQRVLDWTVAQARHLAAQLSGPQQAAGYATLEAEFDNLRALLAWSKGHDLAGGLRLAADLWRFWQVKGHAKEMLDWFDEVVPRLATAQPALADALQADAFNAAGVMARTCGRNAHARSLYEASLALQRRLGNRRGEAIALNNLCLIARDQQEHEAVLQQGAAGLALAREIGERQLEALALMHLGTAQRGLGRPDEAQALFQQSLAIFRELGQTRAQGTLLNFLGNLALAAGRVGEAEGCFQRGLALNEALQDHWGLGISCGNLAALAWSRGDEAATLALLRSSLVHYRRAGARHGVESCFELMARLARRQGEPQRAAWCWGVVEQLEQELGKRVAAASRALRGEELAQLAAELPAATLADARQAGRQVALAEALDTLLR